jgi:hypothetical protein
MSYVHPPLPVPLLSWLSNVNYLSAYAYVDPRLGPGLDQGLVTWGTFFGKVHQIRLF